MSALRRARSEARGTQPRLRRWGVERRRHLALGLLFILAASCTGGSSETERAASELEAGLAAHQQGDLETAAEHYREVLVLDPNNEFAYYNLGLVEQSNGNMEAAESNYRQAIAIDPEFVSAIFNLAIVRSELGDLQGSIELYRQVITLQPTHAQAHLNLGFALKDAGRRRESRSQLEIAVALDPTLASRIPAEGEEPDAPPEDVQDEAQASPAADLVRAACALPHEELLRVWRGTDPDRSGQVVFVPDQPHFVGSDFPHIGPWDYLQEVPLFWYGPGVIPALGRVDRPVTVADIAPTESRLLGFDFRTRDGKALREIPAVPEPPRLIVTLVWDAGGISVLDAYPQDWPVLASLIGDGVWYEGATVGSSPTITTATHATIGTGAFPMRTGQPDGYFLIGDELVSADEGGPLLLMQPTLGDLYDRAMGNEPLVGVLASVNWHLNMVGHGAAWGGGDRDVAVLWAPAQSGGEGGGSWSLQTRLTPYYAFPGYVNDLPSLSAYTEEIDREDGALDGGWRGNSIEQHQQGWSTPASIPFQSAMIEEVIAREGFGTDAVPDLLFVNYKAIDRVSHIWSANSDEMADTLRWQDRELGRFIEFLDTEVGRRRWVLVLTADHSAQYDPAVSGAFQVTTVQLREDLRAAFPSAAEAPVITEVRNSQLFVNDDAMRQSGYTPEQIARFILAYTKARGHPDGPDAVSAEERDDRLFSAALPIRLLEELPCLPEAR